MPRKPSFPSYPKQAHGSGQARIAIQKKSIYLGPHGSPESYSEYNRLLQAWLRSQTEGASAGHTPLTQVRTVADLVARWTVEMESRYDGSKPHHVQELAHYRQVLQIVYDLYGKSLVAEFGPVALRAVRSAFVARGWCRNRVNRQTTRVKTMVRWGLSQQLLPPSALYADLWAVKPLQPGQGATETEDVPPVAAWAVDATLPHLSPMNRALVQLLRLTGARPSELFRLRPEDLDRTGNVELSRGYRVQLPGNVWTVRLREHKTSHKGKLRFLVLGPLAQAILVPLLTDLLPGALIFTPARSRALWEAEKRRGRKTPVQPSQADRSKAAPLKVPGERYTAGVLNSAVARAIDRANKGREGEPVPHWFCYQLRHLAAARLREEFGETIAAAVLGHSVEMLRKYALSDLQSVAEAMGKAG